jgi:hypothetical protein
LQDRIAFNDASPILIEARAVERMRHLADQATHRVAGQSRVRIERHDVPNAFRGDRRSEPNVNESGVGGRA